MTDTVVQVGLRPLRVNELYGPVLQGEGPDRGRPMVFLRLAGCNLDCGWCDTPYSWDWDRHDAAVEITPMPVTTVSHRVRAMTAGRHGLCVTGGEPMLQQTALAAVLRDLPQSQYVAVETNGTRAPTSELIDWVDTWVVSPKLRNSGIDADRRIRPLALEAFSVAARHGSNVHAKFVVKSPADCDEALTLWEQHLPDTTPWVMPEGRRAHEVYKNAHQVERWVIDNGWHMTLRDHVWMHGSERGR